MNKKHLGIVQLNITEAFKMTNTSVCYRSIVIILKDFCRICSVCFSFPQHLFFVNRLCVNSWFDGRTTPRSLFGTKRMLCLLFALFYFFSQNSRYGATVKDQCCSSKKSFLLLLPLTFDHQTSVSITMSHYFSLCLQQTRFTIMNP